MSADRRVVTAEEAAELDQGKPGKRSAADRIVELAAERYDLARAEDGEPFAVERGGPNVARLFRGGRSSLRAALAAAYAAREGRVPPAQSLVDALAVLEGQALAADRRPLPLRAVRRGRDVLLDLGDETGRVVRITADGWDLLDRSPVTFRRTELTGALPVPERGGTLDDLWRLVNVTPDDRAAIVAHLLSGLLGLPTPILLLRGPAGAAKTTAARLHATLLDPSPAPTRAAPRDPEGWAVAAAGSFVVALDNIDTIPSWLSDALCRAVTGEAFVRRALYTDASLAVLSFRRAIVLTAIDPGAMRGDLSDRLLAVDLEPIPDDRRRDDGDVAGAFAAAHPALLGALLDLAVATVRRWETTTLTRRPRMADYARVLAAVDAELGTGGLARYMDQRGDLQREAAEGDRLGARLLEWLPADGWSGTAADLLEALTPDRPQKDWPTTPRALSGALRRVAQPLAAAGIVVEFTRESGTGGRRVVRLRREGSATVAPSQPSQTSVEDRDGRCDGATVDRREDGATVAGFRAQGDGRDGSDGPIPSVLGQASNDAETGPRCGCGKAKVPLPDGRFVCTNSPGHPRVCPGCNHPHPIGTTCLECPGCAIAGEGAAWVPVPPGEPEAYA